MWPSMEIVPQSTLQSTFLFEVLRVVCSCYLCVVASAGQGQDDMMAGKRFFTLFFLFEIYLSSVMLSLSIPSLYII